MTTDVLALREALERLRYASRTLHATDPEHTREWEDCGWGDCVKDREALAAVRAETLAGSGVVSMAAVQKAVGILRDYSHGEECAVYAEDDDLVDVYDDPTNEACDCGLRDLILTLTGALPDVGATALALAATPPTPPLTAARLAVAMHETTMGCANHGSDWHSYHIGVARILFAALASTPPAPAVERCGWEGRCGEVRDHEAHRPCGAGSDGFHHTYGCHPFHRAEPTPEKAP